MDVMNALSANESPSRPRTAKDYIYQQVTAALVAGKFTPGERILEKDVSEWLQVSRTPVREALSALEADGLVEIIPHKGAVVRRLTGVDIRDEYIVRAALESLATELAVPQIAPAALMALRDANDDFVSASQKGRMEDALTANHRFHMELYRASGSHRLIANIESVWRRADYFRRFVYAETESIAREDHMHGELLAAVAEGDAAVAASIVKDSLLEMGDRLARDFTAAHEQAVSG